MLTGGAGYRLLWSHTTTASIVLIPDPRTFAIRFFALPTLSLPEQLHGT